MTDFNRSLFDFIYGLSHRNALADDVGVFVAQFLPYFMLLGFLVFLAREKHARRRMMVLIEAALATILSRGILTEAIRFFYRNPRPFDVLGVSPLIPGSGPSFPSGHVAFYLALAFVLWSWDRRWGAWYAIFALVNGLARIYAGVHWPLDVAGGVMIAAVGVITIRALLASSRRAMEAGALPEGSDARGSGSI